MYKIKNVQENERYLPLKKNQINSKVSTLHKLIDSVFYYSTYIGLKKLFFNSPTLSYETFW